VHHINLWQKVKCTQGQGSIPEISDADSTLTMIPDVCSLMPALNGPKQKKGIDELLFANKLSWNIQHLLSFLNTAPD